MSQPTRGLRRFRKKPVVIEAMRLMEPNTPGEAACWCGGKVCSIGAVGEKVWIEIDTLEGTMRADYGDWIIKGVQGEFYPCKPDIFELTYDPEEVYTVKKTVCDACGKELGRGNHIHNTHALELRMAAAAEDDAYVVAHFCSWECLAKWAAQRDDDARSGKADITAPAPPLRPRTTADLDT